MSLQFSSSSLHSVCTKVNRKAIYRCASAVVESFSFDHEPPYFVVSIQAYDLFRTCSHVLQSHAGISPIVSACNVSKY